MLFNFFNKYKFFLSVFLLNIRKYILRNIIYMGKYKDICLKENVF